MLGWCCRDVTQQLSAGKPCLENDSLSQRSGRRWATTLRSPSAMCKVSFSVQSISLEGLGQGTHPTFQHCLQKTFHPQGRCLGQHPNRAVVSPGMTPGVADRILPGEHCMVVVLLSSASCCEGPHGGGALCAPALSRCCSSSSRSRMLSVNSLRCLPIPRSFTGCRLAWGGSYGCGQHTSVRNSQVLSGSTRIKWRKTLQKAMGRKERRVRRKAFDLHPMGSL